jgi:hypothetical protein
MQEKMKKKHGGSLKHLKGVDGQSAHPFSSSVQGQGAIGRSNQSVLEWILCLPPPDPPVEEFSCCGPFKNSTDAALSLHATSAAYW